MNNMFVPFRPRLEGDYRHRFYEQASRIVEKSSAEEIEYIVSTEVTWAEEDCFAGNLNQRQRYRAIWLFLRDLIRAGWRCGFNSGVLEMRLPQLSKEEEKQNGSLKLKKEQLRKWMADSREERLLEHSDFVRRMETISQSTIATHPISALIADGEELLARIENAAREGKPESAVQPYLQEVDENSRDEYTQLKLAEIWRYFRLTWATPSETTPGRTMLFLIRDAAHPMHAVMGIASLENCAVQITHRDNYIGWSTKTLVDNINAAGNTSSVIREELGRLFGYLREGINGIDYTGLCVDADVESPTQDCITRLQELAILAERERQDSLRLDRSSALTTEQKSELGSISRQTEQSLYLRKRAAQLASLLISKRTLQAIAALSNAELEEKWESFANSDNGASAIRSAFVARKVQHIGSSLMELNVCGAVQPYNELLAGKLVAMLATSPFVVDSYRRKYGNSASQIATRLKNEDVVRPAELVYIGTTSLYYVGSSQYNRIKIPKECFENGQSDVAWLQIGQTMGYGTMHISRATTQCFAEMLDMGYSHINHVFGEGASPKMRQMSSAIRELLEATPDETRELSKHAMSRIVYGAPLIKNLRGYLLGDEAPQYYCNMAEVELNTRKIVEYWLSRWFVQRTQHKDIMERLRHFDKASYLISSQITVQNAWKFKSIDKIDKEKKEGVAVLGSEERQNSSIEFLKHLYRGSSAYADNIEAERLRLIHIETDLDNAIIDALSNDRDVVLTGNPGDGKTHIIRVLMEQIAMLPQQPFVELDASTKSSIEIFESWNNAREEYRPYCIAINAAVLYQLAQDFPEFEPVQEAYNKMITAIYPEARDDSSVGVAVYDLSRRNNLHQKVVKDVIKNICQKDNFFGCKNCPSKTKCDVARNARQMQSELFQERLTQIFNRAYLMGYHATLRDLQGFFSYLLLGDRDCSKITYTSGKDKYWLTELVYSGRGILFEAVRKIFDPMKITHPQLDELLLSNGLEESTWDKTFEPSKEAVDPSNIEHFAILKRKFYFFNKMGQALIDISDDYGARFDKFLLLDDKTKRKQIVERINHFFGDEKNQKSFRVWQGHRYDFSPRRILFSSTSMTWEDFDIIEPSLSADMKKGIEFSRNFILFKQKDSNVSLKIDYDFYSMLLKVESGIPMLYMDNDMVKRMWLFIEQLTNLSERNASEVEISLYDVQSKRQVVVEIDLEELRYTKITKAGRKNG